MKRGNSKSLVSTAIAPSPRRHSGKFCARVGGWLWRGRWRRKIYPESRLVLSVPHSFQHTGFRIKNDFLREKSFLSGMTPVFAMGKISKKGRHSGKFCARVGGWLWRGRWGRKIYPESRLVPSAQYSFQHTGFRIKNDFLREKSFLSGMTPVVAVDKISKQGRHSGKFCARVGGWLWRGRWGRKIYPESRLVPSVPHSFQHTGFRIKNDFLKEKSFLSGMTLVVAHPSWRGARR